MKDFDVVVVGAGPAGAMACLSLARNGHRVALLEKYKLPRYKVCGGGLVLRARNRIPKLPKEVIETEFRSVNWAIPSDQMNFVVERPYPVITMVMRDKLDNFLVDEAVAAGTEIMDQAEVTAISKNGSYQVTTSGTSIKAHNLVLADGAFSPTSRLLGMPDGRYLIPAIEAEVRVKNSQRFSQTRFDVEAIPHGYGWVFPKADHLSIGIASALRGKINLQKAYRSYLSALGIEDIISEKKYGFQIPVSPRKTFSREGVMLTGDAAGFADPLVAEGISQAIISGHLAADAISQAEGDPMQSSEHYEALVRSQILGQIKTGKILSKLFYRYPKLRRHVLRRKGQRLTEYFTDVFSGLRRYPETPFDILNSFRKALL